MLMPLNLCNIQSIEYSMYHTIAAILKYSAISHEMAAPIHSNAQYLKVTKR